MQKILLILFYRTMQTHYKLNATPVRAPAIASPELVLLASLARIREIASSNKGVTDHTKLQEALAAMDQQAQLAILQVQRDSRGNSSFASLLSNSTTPDRKGFDTAADIYTPPEKSEADHTTYKTPRDARLDTTADGFLNDASTQRSITSPLAARRLDFGNLSPVVACAKQAAARTKSTRDHRNSSPPLSLESKKTLEKASLAHRLKGYSGKTPIRSQLTKLLADNAKPPFLTASGSPYPSVTSPLTSQTGHVLITEREGEGYRIKDRTNTDRVIRAAKLVKESSVNTPRIPATRPGSAASRPFIAPRSTYPYRPQ